MNESFDRSRRGVAERRDVDRVGERYPDHEYGQQQQCQRRDGADRGRLENIESTHCRRREAGFPAPAQFIQAKRGDRSDQGEAARQGVEQRQDRVAERQPRQQKADDGINDAKEHGRKRHLVEHATVPRCIGRKWYGARGAGQDAAGRYRHRDGLRLGKEIPDQDRIRHRRPVLTGAGGTARRHVRPQG